MSFNKYIKNNDDINNEYQKFKEKKDIDFKRDINIYIKSNNNLFKSKPFKLSIALTVLVLIISITIIGVSYIGDNKYNHYKLYESGEKLNEVLTQVSFDSQQEQGPIIIEDRFLSETSEELAYNSEFVLLDINSTPTKQYLCGYVSNDIKTKIIEAYELSQTGQIKNIYTNFYNDSLFNAYTLCSNIYPYYEQYYDVIKIDKETYPITWYVVEEGKRIYDTIDDNFLLGVLEIKDLLVTGTMTGTQKKYPFLYEKYEYISNIVNIQNKQEYISDNSIYSTWWYNKKRINLEENIQFIDYDGWWSKSFTHRRVGFEKWLYNGKITEVLNIDNAKYINIGRHTKFIKYNDDVCSFSDVVECTLNHLGYECPEDCIAKRGKIEGNDFIDLKDLYSFNKVDIQYKDNVKYLSKDNCFEYIFKLDDILKFIKEYRNFDIDLSIYDE